MFHSTARTCWMMENPEPSLSLKCVASTPQYINSGQQAATDSEAPNSKQDIPSNFFKSADWSPDGTSIITNSADNTVRTFVVPPDLLDDREARHELTPYHALPSTEPIYATAIYPYYDLQDPSTTVLLSSIREHPIRLSSALYPGTFTPYSLISPTTEEFITPHSLLYPASLGGTHFLAGSDSLICLFDVSRPGKDGPVSRLPTIPSKRKKIVGGGIGMKGIISAMAISPAGDGVLAAGTFTRNIGLYASNGSGDTIANFTVVGTEADQHIGGKGITQVLWSPCGRYLFIAERQSDGVLVYDIRVTGQLLGWLQGRNAVTNQRLKVDLLPGRDGSGGDELWAGGIDGVVRVWKNPTGTTGGQDPTWEKQIHNDPISSAIMHPTGSVLATCSGQKQYLSFGGDDDFESSDAGSGRKKDNDLIDNTLKIWAL